MGTRLLKVLLAIVIAFGALASGVMVAVLNSKTIYPNVRVDGIDIGGLSKREAQQRLISLLKESSHRKLFLRYADQTWEMSTSQLGAKVDIEAIVQTAYMIGREGSLPHRMNEIIGTWCHGVEVPMVYSFSLSAAKQAIQELARNIDRDPVDARLLVDGDLVRAVPEKPGLRLDVEQSLERITRAVNTGSDSVGLVVKIVQPKVVQSDFTGITGVIASYSTKYRTWQRDRTHNLMTAARALNGTLIKPGELFSYNEVVGPRQPSRGYRKAPIFVRGEVEQGIGGGVCQVSTTLYNAALLANMEIVSRAHHSRPVDDAPVGRDATVAYPSPDLKFKNTTPAPVYISASVGGGTVNITLFGRKMDDQEVELVSEGHQVIRPRVIRIADKNLSPGEEIVREAGRPGHRVKIYRIIKKHGQVIKKELICSDFYKPEDRVVAFGELQDSAKSATVSIDKAKSSVYNN